jgi:hypothetical protein
MSSKSQAPRSLLESYLASGELTVGTVDSRARAAAKRDPELIARRHAELLQYRKEIEAEILDSIIALSTYPLVREAHYSAASPAAQDVADLKRRIRIFQPGDYDDLLEERNANGLCGYTLCAKPKRKKTPGGKYKLIGVGTKSFDIVDRKEHERWCSQLCAKRALYIKVQLNETAAWEREGLPDLEIDLYEEEDLSKRTPDKDLGRQLEKLELDEEEQEHRDAELARERGDEPGQGPRVTVAAIRSKETQPPVAGLSPDDFDDESHLCIEGYRPKISRP